MASRRILASASGRVYHLVHSPDVIVEAEPDFGATVRARRLARGVGLRRFAAAVGLAPTYLSKIERGVVAPPAEARVVAIATALGADPDEWLALAGRVATDVLDIIRTRPREMAAFLREAGDWPAGRLTRLARERRGTGR